ncbi:MAG: hypothetical protein V1739_04895 [Candidatus Omnitrophota bacterium]
MAKKPLRKISPMQVRIFKIVNRRGYAAISLNNLTEGTTANQAYGRMIKALKRHGYELPVLVQDIVKKRVVSRI